MPLIYAFSAEVEHGPPKEVSCPSSQRKYLSLVDVINIQNL